MTTSVLRNEVVVRVQLPAGLHAISPLYLTSRHEQYYVSSKTFDLPTVDEGDSSGSLDYPLPTCYRPWYLRPEPPATNPDEGMSTSSDYDSTDSQPEDGDGSSADNFASLDKEFQPDYEESDSDFPTSSPPLSLPEDYKPNRWDPPCPSLTMDAARAVFYMSSLPAGTHEFSLLVTPTHPGVIRAGFSLIP